VGLFEVGRVFDRAGDPADPPSFESRRFALAITGEWREQWGVPPDARKADFFDAKGLVEMLLSPWVSAEGLRWPRFSADAFAPGAAARVEGPAGVTLGVVGQISALEAAPHKLSDPVFVAELLVEAIPAARSAARFEPYSLLPPIRADLSFAQPAETPWEEIERIVRDTGLANLESVAIADRYAGRGVPEGKVKTTVRLAFRSPERTLSQEEVNREVQKLRERLESIAGASFGS
jgi:phenylalanyl-tRNA synthetase beta chain